MKKYYQKTTNDCLTAVIATMLQINPETIPLFIKDDEWLVSYGDWLREKHGVYLVQMEYNALVPYINKGEYLCIGTLNHGHRKHSHAVILKNTVDGINVNLEIYHDPLGKDSPYDIGDLTHIEFYFNFGDKLNK